MLQAGHSTEFTLVVWWNRFTGAAVLPHILKTCKHVIVTGYLSTHRMGEFYKLMSDMILLLTNNTVSDPFQLFAERRHGVDRCPFGVHYENNNIKYKGNTL